MRRLSEEDDWQEAEDSEGEDWHEAEAEVEAGVDGMVAEGEDGPELKMSDKEDFFVNADEYADDPSQKADWLTSALELMDLDEEEL